MKVMKFRQFIEQDILYEFANLDSRRTGIENIVIHCYSQGDGKKLQHGPRIKVSNIYGKFSKTDNFVIEIKTGKVVEGEVKIKNKELQILRLWITMNKKELISYWEAEGEMTTDDFLDSIKKVS